jgi:hypothetical protein
MRGSAPVMSHDWIDGQWQDCGTVIQTAAVFAASAFS